MRVIVIFLSKSDSERAQKSSELAHEAALHCQGMMRLRFHISLNGR
jgi:hypothetical protein